MVTAKFHAIGNSSLWFRTRIQEEINTTGLQGSTIHVGENKLAIIVDGNKENIERLYDNLREASPEEIGFTKLVFDEGQIKRVKTGPTTTNDITEILKEIEKNMRKINQKLDVILARGSMMVDSDSGWGARDGDSAYREGKERMGENALDSDDNPISSFFKME